MAEQQTAKTTTTAPAVSLATLMTPSKTITMDYAGIDGFTVDVTYLAREELLKLRNKCLKQKFNKKNISRKECE